MPSRGRFMAALAVLSLAFVILVSLGTWQVERLQWKEALIAEIEARRTAKPMTAEAAAAIVAKGGDVDYAAITVTGTFDNAHEFFFLATLEGQPGFHVYAPLRLADGKSVIVNRGFVPEQLKDTAKRPQGQLQGELTVVGLARARLMDKPSSMVPDNEPAKDLYFWKDMDAMAAQAGIDKANLLPFFVDAGNAPNPGGYPQGGITQIDLPNSHLSYAVTWYGLALAMVAIAVLAFRKRARESNSRKSA
jgi:surfeit locus 1 family protein